MPALKLVLWGFLAILGSVALAFVTGLINPSEKVLVSGWLSRRVVSMCWPIASMGCGLPIRWSNSTTSV